MEKAVYQLRIILATVLSTVLCIAAEAAPMVSDVGPDIEEEGIVAIFDFEPMQEEQATEVFNDTLIKEFEQKYQYEFGYTAIDNQYVEMNKFTQVTYAPGVEVTVEQDGEKRRRYGEFILRRLTEYHVDDYAKNNEKLRPAFEVKQKLSNYKVQVDEGYSLSLNYSISGNTMRVKLGNPTKMDAYLTYDFNKSEQVVELHYPVNKKTQLGTYYRTEQGSVSVVSETIVTSHLTALVSGKAYRGDPPALTPGNSFTSTTSEAYLTSPLEYDNMLMVGLKWRL